MQFFEHQDQARGRTTLLVVLFTLSVLGLGAITGGAMHYYLISRLKPGEPLIDAHWATVSASALATLGIIVLGSAYRLAQLSGGGKKVAETLGGSLLTGSTDDLLERRALNIVEEMAIAAGLPVPPVYILRKEKGINAFAAGWSPDDAVLGITTGALESLNRDQLQGVIAHEFSHILNRDCALNMKLMGVLHGIVVISIIGRILIQLGAGSRHRSSRSEGGGAQFMILGAAIWLFGSIGVLIARFIQSAVSQQREYLADASAVQFTRNPEGIGGALATIGSQSAVLTSPRRGEASHMLIGEPGATNFLGALSSHPPLFERIKRILPRWDGDFEAIATPPGSVRAQLNSKKKEMGGREFAMDMLGGGLATHLPIPPGAGAGADMAGAMMENALILEAIDPPTAVTAPQALASQAATLLAAIPRSLRGAAEDPFSARALIFAWILDDDVDSHETQMALLSGDPPLARETEKLRAQMPSLDPVARLPLFDIAVGTLAALSDRQKTEFRRLLEALEAQLSAGAFRNFCLASLAIRHLDPRGKEHKIKPVLIKDAIETVLGVLAVQGHDTVTDAEAAFAKGRAQLGNRGEKLSLPQPGSLSVQRLEASFATLLRLPHSTRAELLDAAEFIASHDGTVRPSEAELLRTMAACLSIATQPAFACAP